MTSDVIKFVGPFAQERVKLKPPFGPGLIAEAHRVETYEVHEEGADLRFVVGFEDGTSREVVVKLLTAWPKVEW